MNKNMNAYFEFFFSFSLFLLSIEKRFNLLEYKPEKILKTILRIEILFACFFYTFLFLDMKIEFCFEFAKPTHQLNK
jgi:hypothetical protein